jgi:hypothetical protein
MPGIIIVGFRNEGSKANVPRLLDAISHLADIPIRACFIGWNLSVPQEIESALISRRNF